MIVTVYRSWVDGLSFERTGRIVAKVAVPEGASLELVGGLFSQGRVRTETLLLVPCMDDPAIRYAWGAVDIIADAGNPGSRFRLVETDRTDRHALLVEVGAN